MILFESKCINAVLARLDVNRGGITRQSGEKPVLKLVFGAMMRAAKHWPAVRVSELERRQMRATREELNQEYEAAHGLKAKTSAAAHQARISSTS